MEWAPAKQVMGEAAPWPEVALAAQVGMDVAEVAAVKVAALQVAAVEVAAVEAADMHW